jgi:PTS system nitrogen regulatory IIA component
MDIMQSIREEACTVSLEARDKQSCLAELAQLVGRAAPGLSADSVLAALEAREKEGSTALSDGVAIPHARLKETADFVLGICVSRKGVKFQSPDGKKTHIFFLLIGPEEKPEDYLKLLARVSRVAKSRRARTDLRHARSVNALKEGFIQNSGMVMPKKPRGKMKLLTIVLFEQGYLDDITQLFLERGIRGASVVDSRGITDVLTRVPLFASFLDFLGERRGSSKTLSIIIEESEIPALVEGVEGILGDLDTHTGAVIYTTDVDFMKGSLEIM